jgi:hypothetical protein
MSGVVELWSDLACVSGAKALGVCWVLDGREGPQLDNSDTLEATILPDTRTTPAARQVLRRVDGAGNVREYRVQSVKRILVESRRRIRALGPLNDLATGGLCRSVAGGVTSYAVGGTLSPSDHVSTIVLANLAADGLAHWGPGTIEPTTPVTLTAPAEGWTRLAYLTALADATGAELRARRNGATSYLVDLLTRTGSTAATVVVATGKNLIALEQDLNDAELATALTMLGNANGDGRVGDIGENLWTLGTIPGSAPYWIPLTDPAGGAGPVAFASQFGTASTSHAAYLLRSDAGTTQITDARLTAAGGSEVLVAATTGLVAGERVQLVADSSATRLAELRAPNVARLHRTDRSSVYAGEANLVRNPTFASWSSDTAADHWTGTVAKYARTTPTSLTLTITANAANLTAVAVSGPANALVCKGDIFLAAGGPTGTVFVTATVRLNGSGTGTLALSDVTGSTAYAATSGATLTLSTQSNRPASFPTDGLATDACRIARTAAAIDTALGAAWRVKYVTGLPYVCAAVGWTHAVGVNGPITATSLGLLEIRNTGAGSTLASAYPASDLPASTTRHETVQTAALLSADTTVAVRLTASSSMYAAALARWVWLWLASTSAPTVPAPLEGAFANALWQRANRALLARALTVGSYTLTLADLSTLAGASLTREALTLGGSVFLEALGVTVRVVGIGYSLTNDRDVSVVVDGRPMRLTKYLAERLG